MYFKFLDYQVLHFWQENDVTKLAPNLFFSIMGYLMMVFERTYHKDLKN